jgi:hypothetical protein
MRYAAALIVAATLSSAATLEQYGSLTYRTDSLAGSPARTEVIWGAMLDAGDVGFELEDRFLVSDSGGTVPRWTREGNDLLASARASYGMFTIRPDIRWQTALEGDSILLGVPEATPVSQGDVIRPGGSLGIDLGSVAFHGFGRYWTRDMYTPAGTEAGWTSTGFGGGGRWISPTGAILGVSGASRTHDSDIGDLYSDWSRLDLSISSRPLELPTRTMVMADAEYSLYTGEDYTGAEIADRASGRIRAVQSLSTSVSYNMTMAVAMDHHEDGWSVAKGMAGARMLFIMNRGARVPSTVNIGTSFSSSVVNTTSLDIFSRAHLYRGVSLLGSIDARRTPTDVAGAPQNRRSLVLGGGLEYQMGKNLRCWLMLEQERTEYQQVENWGRFRAGLDVYPGVLEL